MLSKSLAVFVCALVMIGGRALCAAQSEGSLQAGTRPAFWPRRVRSDNSSPGR